MHVWRFDHVAGPAGAQGPLREVLSRYLGEVPAAIELGHGEHGKPRLAASPAPLEFNLAHSGAVGLVAVAALAVGVDVEREKPGRNFLGVAARVLAPAELARVRAAPEPERAAVFYAAWARHEARLKCGGGGFGGPAPDGPVAVADIAVGPGYAAAVAVAGEMPPAPQLYRLDLR